jgi:hypothetical protein
MLMPELRGISSIQRFAGHLSEAIVAWLRICGGHHHGNAHMHL